MMAAMDQDEEPTHFSSHVHLLICARYQEIASRNSLEDMTVPIFWGKSLLRRTSAHVSAISGSTIREHDDPVPLSYADLAEDSRTIGVKAGESDIFDFVRPKQIVDRGGVERVERVLSPHDDVAFLGRQFLDDFGSGGSRRARLPFPNQPSSPFRCREGRRCRGAIGFQLPGIRA